MSKPEQDFLAELIGSAQRELPASLEAQLRAIPATIKVRRFQWIVPALLAALTPLVWLLSGQQIADQIDRLQVGLEQLVVVVVDQLVGLATHFAANEPEVMATSVAIFVLFTIAALAATVYVNYQGRNELYSVMLADRR